MDATIRTSLPAQPATGQTVSFTEPVELAAAPLASGVPTVRLDEVWAGGLQEAKLSEGACMRFGDTQATCAGTSGVYSGVAPCGRA